MPVALKSNANVITITSQSGVLAGSCKRSGLSLQGIQVSSRPVLSQLGHAFHLSGIPVLVGKLRAF